MTKSNRLLKGVFVGVGVMVLFVGVPPFLIQWTVNLVARRMISPHFSLSLLGLNIFTGKARMGVSHSQSLGIKDYVVHWDYLPLRRRILRIPQIKMNGVSLRVDRFPDGLIQIEDIQLNPTETSPLTEKAEPDKPFKPVTIQVGEVALRDVQIAFSDHSSAMEFRLKLDHFTVRPDPTKKDPAFSLTVGSRLERTVRFSGTIQVEGLTVQIPRDSIFTSSRSSALIGASGNVRGSYQVEDFYWFVLPDKGGGIQEWALHLGSFSTPSPTRFEASSDGLRSPFLLVFDPVMLNFANLDSAKPELESSFSLSAQPAKGASLELNGKGRFFQTPPFVDQTLVVKDFPITALSPLAERFINYRITKGQLDVDAQTRINKSHLDAKNEVVFNNLSLDKLGSKTKDPLGDRLGMPLGTAVALLKDAKGNINLRIPVSADLTDPNVSPSSLVKQAGIKGVQSGVTAALRGSFSTSVSKLGAGAFSLDLPHVDFVSGQDVLLKEGIKTLDKLAHLLAQRPMVIVHLGGVATSMDVYSIRGSRKGKKPLPLPSLGEYEKKAVFDLAERRAEACRTYLKIKHGLGAERLAKSEPGYSADTTNPRVEIVF